MSVDDHHHDPDYVAWTWGSYRPRGDASASSDSFRAHDEPLTAGARAHSSTSTPVAGSGLRTETAGGPNPARVATRRAHLRLSRIDPVSVGKVAFVVSLVCFVGLLVAVGVLYGVLASMGVFEAVDSAAATLTASETELFPASSVFGYTFLVGLLNVALMTALATIGAVVYNVIADFFGGIEVTLSEADEDTLSESDQE